MGFFLSEQEAERLVLKPRPAARAKRTIELGAKGCDNCPLQESWPRLTSARMPLSGNTKDPDILVLGEFPSEEDDRQGSAFVGPAGKMLRQVIPGRDLQRVAFQNMARCHPFKNDALSAQIVHACSVHLEEDIARYDFKAILGVGVASLNKFFPGARITAVYGTRLAVEIAGKTLWYWPVFHPSFILQSGGERSPNYPVFRADVRTFFRDVDKWKPATVDRIDPKDVIVPATDDEAQELIDAMEGPLGFDIETGTDKSAVLQPYKHGARILTAAWSDGDITMAYPVQHPSEATSWGLPFTLKTARKRKWIAHNTKFELLWLLFFGRQMDPDYEPAAYDDSMAMARVFFERNTILALDEVSRIILGVDIKTLTNVNAAQILNYPLDEVLPYNGVDAWASAMLAKRMLPRLPHKDQYGEFLESIRSTVEMELMGLSVDFEEIARLKDSFGAQIEKARNDARSIYEVRQYEIDRQVEFNIGAPEQVGEALATYAHIPLPKTSNGKYASGEEHLRSLAGDNPLALATLSYREATKIVSTYCDSIIEHCAENIDGIQHSEYTVLHTHTTRLSGREPNPQNYPKRRHREVRRQIVAPPEHLLVAMDAKQLEARVFGMASKDRALCSSIISGEDIHSYWLHRILDRYPDYVERLMHKTNEETEKAAIKAGRDIIKTDFVFASFYGSIAASCAERTGLPLLIVEEILAEFWQRYDGAKKWGQERRRIYADTGSGMLMNGFTRHGPMPGNEPYNTPIQGTGALLILAAQNALSKLARELKEPYLHPRINIHDDLTFILPEHPDKMEAYIDIIVPELVKVRYPWQIIPLAVEVKAGPNWADLEYVADFTGEHVR